jgi:hypothetical protein
MLATFQFRDAMIRVPQPPMNPSARGAERHPAWLGLVMAGVGALFALFGLGRLTDIETVQGGLAIEREVNMAFAHGGVRDVSSQPPPTIPNRFGPPMSDEPVLPHQTASPGESEVVWIRIDMTAQNPCPT